MKPCPYCGSLPKLKARTHERDILGRAKSFWYQYNCENKRCKEKTHGTFSSVKGDAAILWDDEIFCGSSI